MALTELTTISTAISLDFLLVVAAVARSLTEISTTLAAVVVDVDVEGTAVEAAGCGGAIVVVVDVVELTGAAVDVVVVGAAVVVVVVVVVLVVDGAAVVVVVVVVVLVVDGAAEVLGMGAA